MLLKGSAAHYLQSVETMYYVPSAIALESLLFQEGISVMQPGTWQYTTHEKKEEPVECV